MSSSWSPSSSSFYSAGINPPLARPTRRGALRLLGSAVGVGLLAACGPAGSPAAPAATSVPATTAPAATAQAASAPTLQAVSAPATAATKPAAAATSSATAATKNGGTLRSAIPADIASLDPHLYAAGAAQTVWLVNERLTAYDQQLHPQPWLAESWDLAPDYSQITFHLRKGVTFDTGRELTSDDIKYNIARLKDPKVGAGIFVNQANWFTSIETPDKYTAVLKSDRPRPLMFDFFERVYIGDQATLENTDNKGQAVGTGPFTLTEWVPGDHLSFARNPNYWQSGLPHLDGVHVAVVRDPQSLVSQFEAGSLDVVQSGLSLRDFARLRQQPGYQEFANAISTGYAIIGMNTTAPPFTDKRVRQAMNLALDRQRFVDTQLLGLAAPMYLPWQPSSPAYDPTKTVPFDRAQARSLLSAAGADNLDCDIVLAPGVDGPVLAQMYQSDLGQIGVTANIRMLDLAAWLDAVNNQKYNGLYWIPSASAASPGSELSTSRGWDPNANNSGYTNDDYARLVNALVTETDPSKLKDLYAQANAFLIDDPFAFPVAPTVPVGLARSNVQGTAIRLLSGWTYVDAGLS
jgi:peptide/nickel transport system substrate-binding protein